MKQDHNDSIYVSVIPHAPRTYYEFTKRIMSRNIGGCQLFLYPICSLNNSCMLKWPSEIYKFVYVAREGKDLILYVYKHI